MRLEVASAKAIKYACLKFHYAKRLPAHPITAFSVFNRFGEWCGVICFNAGIEGINKPYSLPMGQVAELTRVALNGKQEATSKAVAISLKMLKKYNPLVKVVVSYADTDQNHIGVIYQATNWIFECSKKTSDGFIHKKTGKEIHSRAISKTGKKIQFGVLKKCHTYDDVVRVRKGLKHKYIYPLHKDVLSLCKSLSKPYPKQAQEAEGDEAPGFQSGERQGGSDPCAQNTAP